MNAEETTKPSLQLERLSKWSRAREGRGNPPEVQATLEVIHARYAPIWEERKRALAGKENRKARPDGGPQ